MDNSTQWSLSYYYLAGLSGAPGRIRTYDTRFRKRPRAVRRGSPVLAEMRSEQGLRGPFNPPSFAVIQCDSASGVTTALPRTVIPLWAWRRKSPGSFRCVRWASGELPSLIAKCRRDVQPSRRASGAQPERDRQE
jgi:hypothetical protein